MTGKRRGLLCSYLRWHVYAGKKSRLLCSYLRWHVYTCKRRGCHVVILDGMFMLVRGGPPCSFKIDMKS